MVAVLLGWPSCHAQKSDPELTEKGRALAKEYAESLSMLSQEIQSTLPEVNESKKAAFTAAREKLDSLRKPTEDAGPQAHQQYAAAKEQAEAEALLTGRALLTDLESFLASDSLDEKLLKASILRHGSPEGLAEFAQQGPKQKALLDQLFNDGALMKQMLVAGGANGGEYGEAMQVYTAILEASKLARKPGILQRLAVGTSLHMPWIPGKEKGSVNGVVFRTQTKIDQVPRFLHYEKAFLDEELDPAFPDMTTWECRFITNSEYTNEDLAWMRKMLRAFRPDHITDPDYKWRYVRIVKTDVPYTSTRHDPKLGTPAQQAICLGGICGRRAFFGRLATRAFGIPTRASTQTGHAAMSHWTPDGWAINLGAWWSMAWCGPQGGLDFLLDSQAREHRDEYMQVLRARWIGDALGEEDVSLRQYGRGGGFWDGVAFYKKRVIVEDAAEQAKQPGSELAGLTEEEARLLGESDKILGDNKENKIKIPEESLKLKVSEDGVITVPAVACYNPRYTFEKAAFLDSWDGGMQLHYQRLGGRPEILRYTIEVPAAGKYELSALVSTVSVGQGAIFRINRRSMVNIVFPYTKGSWERTATQVIELREGRNSVMLTFRAPNRGVSIKEFRLTPVEQVSQLSDNK